MDASAAENGITMGTVLVIEDDHDLRVLIRQALEDTGYQVASAPHGRGAIEMLRSGPLPQVVLLDLRMPIMDGWQFVEHIRGDPALRELPVIAVSGDPSTPPPGLTYMLRKPFKAEELLELVAKIAPVN